MERLQMYNDVPAIELGTEDYSIASFPIYAPSEELSQYWRSIDPSLNSRRSFDTYRTDTSAHLVNMEKRLLNLANSAYGCGRSPILDIPEEESPKLGLSTIWGSGGEAFRTMRYMSPNGPWGSLSSTNSTPSDYAFSPDVSRHHASLFRNDHDSQASFGSPYPAPFSQSQYSYSSQGSYYGHVVSSPTPTEQTVACSMKELQYTPDPENQEILEDSDCIKLETGRPDKMGPTPESCFLAVDATSRSEYDDSMKEEDDEKSIDSDIDPEYSPSKPQSTRRMSNNKHPARSATLSRDSFVRPTIDGNRILKSSQRQITSTKNKTKSVSRRRSSNKNNDRRPFICSFSRYGCGSRFSSKNEWKRHVSSQHLQLGFYRCDTGPCNPDDHSRTGGTRTFNDFNRKDLFTQHHRRMHTPWTPANKPPSKTVNEEFEEGLEEVRLRCWRERRQGPKRSQCIFCHLRFEGESAWEERMEHIGKHFEKAEREKKDLGEGKEDPELRVWALEQGIAVDCGDRGCWLDGMQGSRRTEEELTASTPKRGKVLEAGDVEEDAVGDEE